MTSKRTEKEITAIAELVKSNDYFEYKINQYNDNFLNESYGFLEANNLTVTYEFGNMLESYVIRKQDVNEFNFKHQFADGSLDLMMAEMYKDDNKAVEHKVAKIIKFKR